MIVKLTREMFGYFNEFLTRFGYTGGATDC